MSIFEVTLDSLKVLERTDFASQGLRERTDLQPLIRDQIEVLDPDLLVIGEEFGDWEESKRRIDLLAVDREANLVVIELKRTESGGHMELQALRYAAMVSTMTFDKAVNIYRDFLQKIGRDDDPEGGLLEFLEWGESDEKPFAQDVRVILASADFSKELTTAVMWLNQRDLDIRCIRLQPYSDGDKILLDVQQVIPLPEAEEFQIQVKEKTQRERQTRSGSRDLTRFDVEILGEKYQSLSRQYALFRVVQNLVKSRHAPEEISNVVDDKFYKRRFRVAEGDLNEQAFIDAVQQSDEKFNPRRWFTGDDNLLHYDGRTYSFRSVSSLEKFYPIMKSLKESYPSAEIRFSPTESAD